MTKNYRSLMMATALATGLTLSLQSAHAAETVQEQRLDAGFINNGLNVEVPHSSQPRPIPSPAEARAALQMPDDMEPAIGMEAAAELPRTDNMRPETKQAQETAGGPQATNAGEDPMRNGSQPGASKQEAETVGARPGNSNGSNGAPAPAVQGQPATSAQSQQPAVTAQGQQSDVPTQAEDTVPPIGATGQTMPSTLSQRNDVLDRVPTMALPMPISDADRKRIFDTVMADKAQAVAGADALIPASSVPTDIALNGMQPLPESLRGIVAIDGLAYVKGESKVLLVRPATRIVYEEIRM